ncbi:MULTISPECIES: hypothetical protein [unclassified Streptosporangium]|uniref:hypothetical protein n=1 Tax=unclassified Streptosporangium TaxID=2632669 RepID=UPI002DD9D1BA|nr:MULTISPECIES: hypothetical protein [unclassified Streptosporangium]WSA26792.1 hypothetical protein OIE13_02515 [Streptosporangium sp. NBC_01810]WSD01783.1 hypothetical protein OG884_07640 [Streptosporangium sp. NBC_01755]
MKLTMLCKDSNSGGQGCPSVYLADSGEMVVQGVQVDEATMGELANLLPGETAVRIDPEVILGAIRRYQADR